MSIWKETLDVSNATERAAGTMVEHLGIEFTAVTDNTLSGRMPVDHRTHQPLGILHGGASCVLAETIGSTAANFCVTQATHYCVGLDINTNHIRSVRAGYVTATAKPFHLGRSTQVWGIDIVDDEGHLISVTRLTMSVLSR